MDPSTDSRPAGPANFAGQHNAGHYMQEPWPSHYRHYPGWMDACSYNHFSFPEEAVGPAGGYQGPPNPGQYGRGGNQDMHAKGPLQHPSMQHPMVHTAGAAAPSTVLQHQQQQLGSSHVHKPHTYCHTQLPDSPPDSGSEPYSPPDGNQSEASSCNAKGNMVSGMTALPQQLYPNPMSAHSSTSPQHSSHPQQQQHPQHPHPALHGHPSPPHHPGHPLAKPAGTPYGPGSYGGGEPPKLNHPPPNTGVQMPHTQIPPQMIASPYSSMNPSQSHKKRKYSESPNGSVTPGLMNAMGQTIGGLVNIKQEPECMPGPGMMDCDDDFTCDMPQDSSLFLDGAYQVIKWQPYQPTKWHELFDVNMKEILPSYRVDADKGFNFSIPDDSFVCQKKNHFQVTVHVGVSGEPRYVKSETGPKKIDNFCIHFKGVKMESTSQSIKVEQSQSDRSKKPFHPVRIDVLSDQVSKVTVGRLHFSETTSNNMRKKGKPNPDQRYFLLVVALHAHSGDENFLLAAHASERIIVRASNPGQFDSDVEVLWQKGHTPDSVVHAGRVGVNTDRPDEALTVHGNIKLTGHIMQPSDERVKINIEEIDGKEQLKKVSELKIYTYEYDEEFADQVGLSDDERLDTGVLAQELLEILPDAVRETGDIVLPSGERIENFLVVNKDRLYMENVGAVKELCKLTDNLEIRIDELEKMNFKLSKLKRLDSMKSTISLRSISSCSTLSLAYKKSAKEPETAKAPAQNGTAVKTDTANPNHKSKPPHHHHHHHHRNGTATKPEESGICSNRFIQITITTLVLVMAFCLVSITTLYILEKQKSHNGLIPEIGLSETTPTSVKPHEAGGGGNVGGHIGVYTTPRTTLQTLSTTKSVSTVDRGGDSSTMSSLKTDTTEEHVTVPGHLDDPARGIPPMKTDLKPETASPYPPSVPPMNTEKKPEPAATFDPASIPTTQEKMIGLNNQQTTTFPRNSDMSYNPYGRPRKWQPIVPDPTPQPSVQDAGKYGSKMEFNDILPSSRIKPSSKKIHPVPDIHVIGTPPDSLNNIMYQAPIYSKYKKYKYLKSNTKLHQSKPSQPPASQDKKDNKSPRTAKDNQTTEESIPPDIITTPSPFNTNSFSDPSGPLMQERCRRNPEQCPIVCCPPLEPLDDVPNYKPTKTVKPPDDPNENSSVNTNKTFVYQVSYASKDTAHKPAQSSPPNRPLDDFPSVSVLDNSPKLTLKKMHANARRRRSVDPETAPAVRPQLKASLKISDNNMTIGTVFCEDEACRAELGGRYSYRMPMHQTFPTAYSTIDFTVAQGLYVSLCHNDRQKFCGSSSGAGGDTRVHRYPMTHGRDGHFDWALPVGYYYTSTYNFRVTTAEHSTDACQISDQEVNHSFAEYKLHFYRVCE